MLVLIFCQLVLAISTCLAFYLIFTQTSVRYAIPRALVCFKVIYLFIELNHIICNIDFYIQHIDGGGNS